MNIMFRGHAVASFVLVRMYMTANDKIAALYEASLLHYITT